MVRTQRAVDIEAGPEAPSIPPTAWVLSGAVAVALAVLAVRAVAQHGQGFFFNTEGDAFLFRATARDPFGHAHAFAVAGRLAEAPLRYGRIGLPILGWTFAFGRPAWVGWSLIAINLASIAAVPGVAAVLLADLGAPPAAAGIVLLVPGLVLNYGHVYADPLLLALLLLACVLEERGRRPAALSVLAAAILVKEVAALALLPWIWGALRRGDRRAAGSAASAVAPYALWCLWVRLRLGEFPFLAHTDNRSDAVGLPFVGLARALAAHTPNIGLVTGFFVITVALGVVAGRVARGARIGTLAVLYTLVVICLGKLSQTYLFENLRVIEVAQVFSVLSITVAISSRRLGRRGLFGDNLDL